MKRKKTRVLDERGPACHSCGELTQIREHAEITNKQLRQPFYYSRWYNCTNRNCKTNLIMPEEFKVMNTNDAARKLKRQQQEFSERQEQINFIRSI